ncbi:SNF2-related protein [Pseudomonas sp. CR3202]|uniref:SNF2-related protein n=1 Tax=Pseudomonas sp. CR3202 TaxID=3351532 RepID=UPI003BF3ED08
MQGSLFDDVILSSTELPRQARMPINLSSRKVFSVLMGDLCQPGDALVITGYSGLDQIVSLISRRGATAKPLRLILGSEPGAARRSGLSLKRYDFSAEVREYWLKRGISLSLSGQIIHCIELIRGGHVKVRYSTGRYRLHAKLYCSEEAVCLGSSNFTEPGLCYQHEANARFTTKEKVRFDETWRLAEYFWNLGEDASDQLLALLDQLLKFVTWQEALARACAELLESDWASRYLQSLVGFQPVSLWPSQQQGIGQALYLLDTVGGVLVADATGSGKTRMGAHLLRAVHDRNWSSARAHKSSMLMVCPPLVSGNWGKEVAKCGFNLAIASQGLLSRLEGREDTALAMQLASAQSLAVDEAHNFLSQNSKRTRHLLHNLADQILLFTATPINRSCADLLRLIDILGADNFEDEVLGVFERLSRGSTALSDVHPGDLAALQAAIASFTLRRTKAQLNAMVEREPEAYRLPNGHVCRYPTHVSLTYDLGESEQDQVLAEQIRVLARNLKGIGHFEKPLILPESLASHGLTSHSYLQMRLHSASSLAAHHVMASLRSSRLALYRHILGERAALEQMGLLGRIESSADDATGNMQQRIEQLMGRVPENRLGIELPAWLGDPDAHRRACEGEIAIYQLILKRLAKLGSGREMRKVQHLLGLVGRHDQVIAFDHYPLTLRYLRHLLKEPAHALGVEVMLGVGGDRKSNEKLQKRLDPESGGGRLIALCSDALSEGVNLQRASTLVHLDMPSVVRFAEQRVGRIDRMDSPHEQIECWWPKDAPAFALKSDERFVARVEEVDTLIGGNLQLPEEMRGVTEPNVITAEAMDQELREREHRSWDGIEDAFTPVRELIEGQTALVGAEVYRTYRAEQAKVLSRVSLVQANEPWIFLCLAGERSRAPRWILLADQDSRPLTNLGDIARQLRSRLVDGVQSLPPTRRAMDALEQFLVRLTEMEKLLLPKRKQRALEQMSWALSLWMRDREWITSVDEADQAKALFDLLQGIRLHECPDWGQLADCWLDLVRPYWAELLQRRGRKAGVMRLRDLQTSLKTKPITASRLFDRIAGIDLRRRWEERIVACIFGYGPVTATADNRFAGDREIA